MRILVPPVYERLGDDPGSAFAEDLFERKQIADNLTRLFSQCDDGLVVTIDADWGEGKTSFVRMWEAELKGNDQFVPIYYDAFAHDFSSDAFVSIAAAIYNGIKGRLGDKDERDNKAQLESLKRSTKNLAINLARVATGMGVSTLTGGLVGSKEIEGLAKKTVDELTFGTLEAEADALFEAYLKSDDVVRGYRESLRSALERARGEENGAKAVIFVDELDRCRPTFAVEVIEKIKHFFNVDGVFFVLAVNSKQLARAVESVYGAACGVGSEYLDKFVHLSVCPPRMSNRSGYKGRGFTFSFIDFLCEGIGVNLSKKEKVIFSEFTIYFGLGPRQVERTMSLVALVVNSIHRNYSVCSIIAATARMATGAWNEDKMLVGNGEVCVREELGNFNEWLAEWLRPEEMEPGKICKVPNLKEVVEFLDVVRISR